LFKRWIDAYLNDWAKVDGFLQSHRGQFCAKVSGEHQRDCKLTASPNRWLKRAAAVSLIIPAKKGQFFPEIYTNRRPLVTG